MRISRLPRFLTIVCLSTSPVYAQSAGELIPPNPGEVLPVPRVEAQETPAPKPAVTAASQSILTLRDIRLKGATALSKSELEENWIDLIGQPVDLASLQSIAARIEADYRAAGYVLSQAVLPQQVVKDGVVELLIVEGFVDAINIEGGNSKQAGFAAQNFTPLDAEKPTKLATIERAVLLSRDSLGGTAESVQTVLSPSESTFGAADMTVQLAPDPVTGFVTLDNRGSRLTGPWSLIAGATSYGVLGLNERIDYLLSSSLNDGRATYFRTEASVPISSLNGTFLDGGQFQLGFDISQSDPDLTQAGSPSDLTLKSNEWNVRAGLMVPFIRTRSENLFGRLSLTVRESEDQTILGQIFDETSTDRLSVLELRTSWDKADTHQGINLVDVTLRQGLDIAGANVAAFGPAAGEEVFTSLRWSLGRLQKFGSSDWSLLLEAQGQFANEVLPNSERFALGNSTIGRGFAPGNTSGDEGFGIRAEIRKDLRGNWIGNQSNALQIYGFGDYGEARDKAIERDGIQLEKLASFGIGARFDMKSDFSISAELARQSMGIANDTTETDHETRAFVTGVFRF